MPVWFPASKETSDLLQVVLSPSQRQVSAMGPSPWCPSWCHPGPNGPLVPQQPQGPEAPLSIQQAWLCPELCPFAIFSTPRPHRVLVLETVTIISLVTEEETEMQKFKAQGHSIQGRARFRCDRSSPASPGLQ